MTEYQDTMPCSVELGDGPGLGGPREFGERGEHRAIQRKRLKIIAGECGVADGDGVIGVRYRNEVRGRFSHKRGHQSPPLSR